MGTNPATSLFTLEGTHVRLEPLRPANAALLWGIAKDHLKDLFQWIPYKLESLADFEAFNARILDEQERGISVPFATFRKPDVIAGTTRYMNMDLANRKVEIGSTWLAPQWQRTVVNTEAKYLMLRCAFEEWGCNRVGLKTDSLNERSRRAIARIGAKEEGTLRNHMVTASGRLRHSVYFSVIREEWPEAKAALEARLNRNESVGPSDD